MTARKIAFMTRLPEPLHALLRQSANNAERSMNSELIYRLERSFDREEVVRLVMDEVSLMFVTRAEDYVGRKRG